MRNLQVLHGLDLVLSYVTGSNNQLPLLRKSLFGAILPAQGFPGGFWPRALATALTGRDCHFCSIQRHSGGTQTPCRKTKVQGHESI
jgi:hypothetical protein